jgi:hypothetical protein
MAKIYAPRKPLSPDELSRAMAMYYGPEEPPLRDVARHLKTCERRVRDSIAGAGGKIRSKAGGARSLAQRREALSEASWRGVARRATWEIGPPVQREPVKPKPNPYWFRLSDPSARSRAKDIYEEFVDSFVSALLPPHWRDTQP